jgi:hypothetical protein
MSITTLPAGPANAAEPPHRSSLLRRWFRRRLAADGGGTVIAVAGLVGLGEFGLASGRLKAEGPVSLVGLAYFALAPALGVLGVWAHGRLVWWTGRLLRGAARPTDIHAACAWSLLPLALIGIAPALAFPLAAAAADADQFPPALAVFLDLLRACTVRGPEVTLLAAAASVAAYVVFLAEAQRCSVGRAVANQVLAAVLLVALLGAGVAGALLVPSAAPVVGVAVVACAAVAMEYIVRRGLRRAG